MDIRDRHLSNPVRTTKLRKRTKPPPLLQGSLSCVHQHKLNNWWLLPDHRKHQEGNARKQFGQQIWQIDQKCMRRILAFLPLRVQQTSQLDMESIGLRLCWH